MPDPAKATYIVCIMLIFLQISYWNNAATILKLSIQKVYNQLHELIDHHVVGIPP